MRKYKDYKHKLKYLLGKSEKEHYDSLMRRYRSNVKKSWGVIKVINKNKVKKCNDTFLINGHEESDIKIICIAFNNFYVNVGPSVASVFDSMLSAYTPVCGLRSASYGLLVEPRSRLKTVGDRTFSVAGPRDWNRLPVEIRDCQILGLFKRKLKTHLFRAAYGL